MNCELFALIFVCMRKCNYWFFAFGIASIRVHCICGIYLFPLSLHEAFFVLRMMNWNACMDWFPDGGTGKSLSMFEYYYSFSYTIITAHDRKLPRHFAVLTFRFFDILLLFPKRYTFINKVIINWNPVISHQKWLPLFWPSARKYFFRLLPLTFRYIL